MTNQVFDTVCQALRAGAFTEAVEALERILENDVDSSEAAATLKCAVFWRERLEGLVGSDDGPSSAKGHGEQASLDALERGDLLLGQWRLFQAFVERLPGVPERCLFAIKQFVFSSALACFQSVSPTDEQGGDADVLLQIGRCCKGMGNYERAIESLERANQERRDDARILAELADCYSLVNESRAAKAFFREAFFIDPQAVDVAGLESPLVQRLADKVRALGHTGPECNEWLPVYGAIWGVFNVKREMKPLELGKLKQSIYRYEKECGAAGASRQMVRPRLLNRYFWLIDHYMASGEPRERVDEVLEKIREIDPRVHDEYTA